MIELLVAMIVGVIVMGAALTLTLSSRGMLEGDENRTAINQNLRAGLDLMGFDIRQAGERMPDDIPAVELLNGASGASDTLLLRRNLIDQVLPVCKDISAGSNADVIFVGKKGAKIPPGCGVIPDTNGDGWPDNLEAWRNYRLGNGGQAMAYIYNPTQGRGEFLIYDAEDNSKFHLHKANSEKWTHDYDVDEGSRVYILEQREFRLAGDILQVVINGDTANPLNLVNSIQSLQGQARFSDGTTQDTLGAADDWADLDSVEITLVGARTFHGRTIERRLATRFFPRNALSL